ncbi:hypothetical protein ASA1KI_09490 [Opitutales bacterium ASA1]|nr:hypothetical protein ASA1KI_09490 [Opitutales bacterium ASA1]
MPRRAACDQRAKGEAEVLAAVAGKDGDTDLPQRVKVAHGQLVVQALHSLRKVFGGGRKAEGSDMRSTRLRPSR